MEIYKDIEIRDLALKYKNNLIISDLHIGLEEALNKQGILIPRFQFKEIKEKLKKLLTKEIKIIIIAGDLKHEFGVISEQEWRHTLQILDLLLENNRKIILIKGNHDTILGPIADKRNLEIMDKFEIDNITILHGDKLMDVSTKIIIMGHQHPAITVRDNTRAELFKCFLKGKYKSKVLIVLPSFSLVNQGQDISKFDKHSPYIVKIDNFEVYVIEDKVYNFGKAKNLI